MRGYHERVVEHYENPRNVGVWIITVRGSGALLGADMACLLVHEYSLRP